MAADPSHWPSSQRPRLGMALGVNINRDTFHRRDVLSVTIGMDDFYVNDRPRLSRILEAMKHGRAGQLVNDGPITPSSVAEFLRNLADVIEEQPLPAPLPDVSPGARRRLRLDEGFG